MVRLNARPALVANLMPGPILALVLALLLVAGCGDDGGGDAPDMNATEGKRRLEQIFRDTAAQAAPDVAAEEYDPVGEPTECTDAVDRGQGTVFWTVHVDVPTEPGGETALLPAIKEHWEGEGFDVDDSLVDTPQPELLAKTDGFEMRALAVPDSGKVNLAGSTPCLPQPEDG